MTVESLKAKNLLKIKNFFSVPDFFVLEYKRLSPFLDKGLLNKKKKTLFLDAVKKSAPKNFFSEKEKFIARSVYPYKSEIKKKYCGIFASEAFEFPAGLFEACEKVINSYYSSDKFLYENKRESNIKPEIMFQKYAEGIKITALFEKNGNFYGEWISQKRKERFYCRIGGNSYFSDFEASDEAGDALSIFANRGFELCEILEAKNVLIEFILKDGVLFIVQASPWKKEIPCDIFVRFENEANYDFHPRDFDASFSKEFIKKIGIKSALNFNINDNGVFLNLKEILDFEKELSIKAKNKSFFSDMRFLYLDFLKKELISSSEAKNAEDALLSLKKTNSRAAFLNFILTRAFLFLGQNRNIKNKYHYFLQFRHSFKKYYSAAVNRYYLKIKEENISLDYDKLSEICKISDKKAEESLFLKEISLSKSKKKRAELLKPDFPLKGIVLSSGFAKGKIKIINGPKDAYDCGQDNIAVSRYFDRDTVSALIRAKGLITSAGGYYSHAAVLARELKKPCIGAISGCDRIFIDGEEAIIKDGRIFRDEKNRR
ncbi:MAG: hypothetical protein GX447_02565 [Elusimicrobia bacterium]|nr:hypothetical protein [Elusimicrobiota bacterium]